jgi:alkylation response protein AidB-like acyl-CoA dehydrogenase
MPRWTRLDRLEAEATEEDALFNLHLSSEQLEFRDTLREFVRSEVKPVALHSDRLQPFEKPLLTDLLDEASRMGLRAFALSEDGGGAGADMLTSCIVMEELAAGDVDLAVVLGTTAQLARWIFDERMTSEQRARILPEFLEDRGYHLAFGAQDYESERNWQYHRPYGASGSEPHALQEKNGEWIVNGRLGFVANAPLAKLIALQVRTQQSDSKGPSGLSTIVLPRATPGLVIGEAPKAIDRENTIRWHHGTGASVELRDCRVPAECLLEGSQRGTETHTVRSTIQLAAINLGVGRAAYEAAIDYAKIRVQGGRPIIQHHSIGGILADIAIKLETARNLVWKAAWVSDHPEAVSDRSVDDLPLHTMARTYTAEAMHEVTLRAAECFGAMGVMRDMPMQKYVHDAMVLLHASDHDSATPLRIAEAVAGFERAGAE